MRRRFVELCEIPSPTGSERRVADRILAELGELGIEVEEDGAAAAAGAGSGNLIARIPGGADPERWVMFCAHLDTVPHDPGVEVEVDEDQFMSAGDTILGADDKAAVAVLIELARGWAEARDNPADLLARSVPPCGIELVFTVAEEAGLRGARQLDLSRLRSDAGFVLDHAGAVHEVITAAPTYVRFEAEFRGLEAHAGLDPEAGRSAIRGAAAAICDLELGRVDERSTASVGLIDGGTATNVVPGRCRIAGEIRSHDRERASELTGAASLVCAEAAGREECDVEFSSEEVFRGYELSADAKAVRIASGGLARIGLAPDLVATVGGSDVNALIERGLGCVLLGTGVSANHTSLETVEGRDLDLMLDLCDGILVEASVC